MSWTWLAWAAIAARAIEEVAHVDHRRDRLVRHTEDERFVGDLLAGTAAASAIRALTCAADGRQSTCGVPASSAARLPTRWTWMWSGWPWVPFSS